MITPCPEAACALQNATALLTRQAIANGYNHDDGGWAYELKVGGGVTDATHVWWTEVILTSLCMLRHATSILPRQWAGSGPLTLLQ